MATLLPYGDITREALHGHRIFVWSHDHPVPPHVHFGRERRVSDWRMDTLECVDPDGFSPAEIRLQARLLRLYHGRILERWHEHWRAQNE